MKELEKENAKLKNSVDGLNKNIKSVNNSINEILEHYKGRLLDMYKYNPDNNLNVLFSSSNAHEVVNTAYILNIFAKEDEAMLNELGRKEFELNNAKTLLEQNKKQVQQQTEELQKKRAEYNSTIKKTDSLLKNVQAEQKQALAAAKELEAAQKAIGNKINALTRQKNNSKKSSVNSKNSGTAAKKSSSKNSNSNLNSSYVYEQPAPQISNSSVKLDWPVRGNIIAHYGTRVHPTFKTKIFNSGIDIKATAGTQVKAAAAGEVLYKGWLKGFGQVVIIDHGNNISTVYGYLASSGVREGTRVRAGTVIGRVGNSGTNSVYSLHFEVRRNGNAINPLNFLRR